MKGNLEKIIVFLYIENLAVVVMRISFIGAGNVATHLARAFSNAGHDIVGVGSRTMTSAERLAREFGALPVTDVACLPPADVYVFAVKDDVLPFLADKVGKEGGCELFLHTAGSVPMSVFEGRAEHYAVLYPMQTFSRARKIDFRSVPCFVEGNDNVALRLVKGLAGDISDRVDVLDSERRRYLHLAAVFACNFANHCYTIAADVLERKGLEAASLTPLILETAAKVCGMTPRQAQTGPAVRFDRAVMAAHEGLLGNEIGRAHV